MNVFFFFFHSSDSPEISLSAITFKVYVLIAGCEVRVGACPECAAERVSHICPSAGDSTDFHLAALSAVEKAAEQKSS